MGKLDDAARERAEARKTLFGWTTARLTLRRPLILVPGWTDEAGACWAGFEQVGPEVLTNFDTHVHSLDFRVGDGFPPFDDFFGFAGDLARYIADHGLAGQKVDFACHSMGGLDTFAALTLLSQVPDSSGLMRPDAFNVMTFDTPFRGFAAAQNQLFQWIANSRRTGAADQQHLMSQLQAMRRDSPQIGLLWDARNRFLQTVDAFWPRGADNYSGLIEVTHESASFEGSSVFDAGVRKHYNEYVTYSDTSHSGLQKGVTHDARAIRDALEIVTRN